MSSPGRYRQIIDGEWTWWDWEHNSHMCCGCCLVHTVDYRVRKKILEARYVVDKDATNRARRIAGIKIKKKCEKVRKLLRGKKLGKN